MHSDTLFGTLVVSCIETTKLQYPNLYFVPRIIMFNFQTDTPTRTIITPKLIVSTNGQQTLNCKIRVIIKLPNSKQSYKGKVKTHKYINRQNQSTTRKLKTVMTTTWYTHF